MGRRTLSMQRRKRCKPEGKKEKEEVVEVMTATSSTTTRHPQKGRTTRMTEEETAALFLADLAVATTTNDDAIAARGTEGGLSEAVKKGDNPSATRIKSKKSSPMAPKTTRSGKRVPADTRKTSTVKPCVLGSMDLSAVPLEEGEEDPSISAEVLRQTAVFLARLTPARSQQFWAMRQVARGELSGRSAARMRRTELTSDDNVREWDEDDEEVVEFTSSGGVYDRKVSSAAGKEEMSSSSSSEGEGEEEFVWSTIKGNKTHAAAKCKNRVANKKRPRGGALFSSNPDLWDD
ncbi:hypothetical protein C3747_241g13 [Trypanosoma cruzi]|uniref:Uncharacterized protein n=2 Tax=Trypanosoma cruzi TaxID=5693 RepID=Q4DDP7_TRYCC|nr:hypothetical protein, conserved [Trypanosoma cruzi]EAN90657.1 hypothetical protein, conserved [Trypanosoma cruzi]PWU97610.1 hypothetical protein C3747_241g13 [Trypanosoma cruzi]|eukprot:XP_812508.1 hypothetical protein [Trypanosoma cruzi strain CL Brener]